MKKLLTSVACSITFLIVAAQKGPEFPKGWVMYLTEHHGAVTNFTAAPDLFASGLSLSPQATIVPGHLRLGGTADGIFFNKKLDGLFGPNLAVKLATIGTDQGSILNVQLQLEYLWGTTHQRQIGGKLQVELIQSLVLGLSAHRDYGLNNWWFQGGLGYNLLHKKRKEGIYDPFDHIKKK